MTDDDDLAEEEAERILAEHIEEIGTTSTLDVAALSARHPQHAKAFERMLGDWNSALGFLKPREALPEIFKDLPRSDGQRYDIGGEIGRGGMGAILEVVDKGLRRQLAMKVLHSRGVQASASPEPLALGRFLEEAQVTAQLDHPGVVPVHELGLDADGRPFFTMKLVRGKDLQAVFELVRKGEDDWNLTRALSVLLRVCEAMAFAHDKGVIHRDLKPANVMVGRYGEVYVMDWGLARAEGQLDVRDLRIQNIADLTPVETDRREAREVAADSPLITMDGAIVGTPCYMAPEQATGRTDEIGPRSDVYALGAMLYHLLSGRMPYVTPAESASPQQILVRLLSGPPPALREIAQRPPVELEAICTRAMQRDPSARYANMGELAHDLRAYLENRVVRAHKTGALVELKKWVVRNKAFAAASATLALVVVIGSYVILDRTRTARAQEASARMRLGAGDMVADFLVGVFEGDSSGSITAQELLDQGNAVLAQGRSIDPRVRAYLEDAMGRLYLSMDQPKEAQRLFHQALRGRRTLYGADSPYVLRTLENLTSAYVAQSRYAEALTFARELVANTEPSDPEYELRRQKLDEIEGPMGE